MIKRWQVMFVAIPFAAALAAAGWAGMAEAAQVDCAVTDVTFRGAVSDACFGSTSGNPPEAASGNVFDPAWGEFDFVVKSEFLGEADYDGIHWTLTADQGNQGTWLLEFASDPSVTKTYDMAVAFKASTQYSAYLFEAETFTTDGQGQGTFLISFTNNGGQLPDLSHMNLYLQPVNGGGGSTQVPTPAALILLGMGMAGLAVGRRMQAGR